MFRIGIIGAGWIAEKMAQALSSTDDICVHAIASRSIRKATAFAEEWNIPKAYGSYEEMVADKEIDLVYIATPHSHHFPHAMLALENGKPVLVEKAFTANAREAERLLETARSRKNITLIENFTMVDLICDDNECRGIIGHDKDGNYEAITANYTVLATGGIGGLFKHSTNYRHLTGDALALAICHGHASGSLIMNGRF